LKLEINSDMTKEELGNLKIFYSKKLAEVADLLEK